MVNQTRQISTVRGVATPAELLGKAMKIVRESAKLGQKELAGKAGVTDSFVSGVEKGNKVPSPETLIEMLKACGLEKDEWDDYLSLLADVTFDKAHPMLKRFIRPVGEDPTVPNTKPVSRSKTLEEGFVPVEGLASCGPLVEAIRDSRWPTGELRTVEWRGVAELVKSKRAFVVIAEGESMLPTIQPGDELLIDPGAKLENDKLALVLHRGEASVKRWFKVGDAIHLRADNPKFKGKTITPEQWETGRDVAYRVRKIRRTEDG